MAPCLAARPRGGSPRRRHADRGAGGPRAALGLHDRRLAGRHRHLHADDVLPRRSLPTSPRWRTRCATNTGPSSRRASRCRSTARPGHVAHAALRQPDRCRVRGRRAHASRSAGRRATRLPREKLRLHLCWGNYEGPHNHDIPLEAILDVVLQAPVGAISFEAANPRHAHEWEVFSNVSLPPDCVLIPGVIDTCTNYIEHPASSPSAWSASPTSSAPTASSPAPTAASAPPSACAA